MIEREGNIISLNGYLLDISRIISISDLYGGFRDVGYNGNNNVEGTFTISVDILFEPNFTPFTKPEIKISIPIDSQIKVYLRENPKDLIKHFKYIRNENYHNYETLLKWWKEEINTKKNLYNICNEWIKKHKPTCAESLIQVDSINLALHEIVENICNEIGYYKYDDE